MNEQDSNETIVNLIFCAISSRKSKISSFIVYKSIDLIRLACNGFVDIVSFPVPCILKIFELT